MMAGKRDLSLDAVRVLACLMVVLMHSPMPLASGSSSLVQNVLSYATAPCIGLFFMVSGALLLPAGQPATAFLRRRLSKVLCPTLVWTAFYIVVCGNSDDIGRTLLSVPFSPQGHGILWFMYTLVGLYIIAPVISPWLESASRRSVEMYLILWGVTLCYPLIENTLAVNQGITGSLYYVSGYAGYFLLGYYLRRWSVRWPGLLIMVAVSAAAPVYCKLAGRPVDFYRVFWYLSVFVAVFCVFYFQTVRRLFNAWQVPSYVRMPLVLLSNLSFGIYLSHIYLLRNVLWGGVCYLTGSYLLDTLIMALAAFAGAALFSYLVSLLPFGAYIIGYKHKKL